VPARVALIIQVPPFSGSLEFLQCIFSPVAYLNEADAHAIVEEILAKAEIEREFLRTVSHEEIRNIIFFRSLWRQRASSTRDSKKNASGELFICPAIILL
jgi:hypothetical protein